MNIAIQRPLTPPTIPLPHGIKLERHPRGGFDIVLAGQQRLTGDGKGLTAEQVEERLDWLEAFFAGRN